MPLPQIWPGTRLSEEEWQTIWKAICRHGLGLASVAVRDWSVDDASIYISNLDQDLIFACLGPDSDRAPFASLASPDQVVSAIREATDQEEMDGFDFAFLPKDFGWCVIGNADGEIFYAERT